MKSICKNGKEKITYIQVYQRVIYIQVLPSMAKLIHT